MYWSRTESPLDLLLYLALCLAWGSGGWLLVTHLFRVRPPERLLSGLAAGFILFITLSNLLSNLFPVSPAFWSAALLVLAGGLASAWRSSRRPWLDWRDLKLAGLQLAALLALTGLFSLIGRGLALFDDYLHIPLVSVMAAGDIPPHFYLNPAQYFAYHYGLQVFAAALARIAGLFPWSAWDVSKAWSIALTLILSWLWFRRITGRDRAATLGSFITVFAGGARWLLLLLPTAGLAALSAVVPLINTGADSGENLLQVLSRPWVIEGGGPFPFPFAFHNGMFVPVFFNLGASGAMPFMTVILLLLLNRVRRFSGPAVFVTGLIFTSFALSAEHLFVLLWIGIALGGGLVLLRSRQFRQSLPKAAILYWGTVLLIGGLLSAVQGGFITETLRSVLLRLQGIETAAAGSEYDYFAFGLRWPPGLISAHFGRLSLFSPGQLVVLLAELGPVLLLAPAATRYALRRLRRNDLFPAGLGLAALLTFGLALFLRYGVERSTTRLPAISLWIWTLLGYPSLWLVFRAGKRFTRLVAHAVYLTAVFGGLVIFAVQMTAIPAPQLTYYINSPDARISARLWDGLPEGAQVFDRIPYRSVALFGQPVRAHVDIYMSLPEWEVLLANPDPQAVAKAGYDFIYLDAGWWWEMKQEQRDAFHHSCIQTIAEELSDGEMDRWLLDISSCRQ
jgi:hypothetical protein